LRRSSLAGFALVLALLAAQALGLWHRTAHAPLPALTTQATHASDHAAHAHHDHASEHAFGHAAGDSPQCRLFDQLALADALLAVAQLLPAFEPVRSFVVAPVEERVRAASAPYEARAPPVVG
jgi:hypothetical protein